MGWAIAAGWCAVAGTACLTLGTGAQAWASLAEYQNMRQQVSKAALDALDDAAGRVGHGSGNPVGDLFKLLIAILFFFLLLPARLAPIRAKGSDEVVQLKRFLRLVYIWGILMIGSALALVAAAIQLAIA